jgi:hypothetical protein
MNINVILQSLDKFKIVYISSISGLICNTILIIPMMIIFNKLGLGAYNGVAFAMIFGLSVSMTISLFNLKRIYNVKYKNTFREMIICIIAVSAMTLVILLLKLFIPLNTDNRLIAIMIVAFYSLIGAAVYIYITYSAKTINHIFGKNIIKRFIKN